MQSTGDYIANTIRANIGCTPEERAVINAIIAEEEAREVAQSAAKNHPDDPETDLKVEALGQCILERGVAIKRLMEARREK